MHIFNVASKQKQLQETRYVPAASWHASGFETEPTNITNACARVSD